MRRTLPPPPFEVVELDYGSADAPFTSVAQQADADEVQPPTKQVNAPSAVHDRRLLTYSTDEFGQADPPESTSVSKSNTLNLSQAPIFSSSSLARQQVETSSFPEGSYSGVMVDQWQSEAASADHEEGELRLAPPPPAYPPPALPLDPDQQLHSTTYAYDPRAPEFHPNLHRYAPPRYPESEFHYAPSASASQSYHSENDYYRHSAEYGLAYSGYDLSYRGPYSGPLHDYPYPPYPPSPASYPGYYQHDTNGPYPTAYNTSMNDAHQKHLLKQQRKREKKQRKRDKKQAVNAAVTSVSAPYEPASSGGMGGLMQRGDSAWVEDGKAQAVAMLKELHARGVPPQRLIEKGIPLHMIEACCVEAGISQQDLTVDEAGDSTTQADKAPTALNSVGQIGQVPTTPAEDELLAKEERGVALTPLEELRRKVLASRLSKAAVASTAPNPTDKTVSDTAAVTTVFDRTATSGEAEALLSQIGESIRSLIRPSLETAAAARGAPSAASVSMQPAVPSSSTRKRRYRDVDAVDNGDVSVTADLAEGANLAETAPSRRQRISYADAFSRKAEMPSGEVNLDAPVPDLPDLSVSRANSLNVTDAALQRRRPVAADFDAGEYHPPPVRPSRFLDVPSGLNTVVDLSDDELGEDEIVAAEGTKGWQSLQAGVNMRDVLLLRQRTAEEHYDTFCTLNGLRPVARSLTPLQEGTTKTIDTADVSTPGSSVSKESLLAQVAAADASSLGTSTPSRDDLLRKELEIKQLMRKIQLMEERKSKQQNATPSPSVSPVPSRFLTTAVSSQSHMAAFSSCAVPDAFGKNSAASAQDARASTMAKPPPENGTQAKAHNAQNGSSSGVRLDPALQKQRETLLALLASKRKSTMAGPIESIESDPSDSIGGVESEDDREIAAEPKQSSTTSYDGILTEGTTTGQMEEAKEVSRICLVLQRNPFESTDGRIVLLTLHSAARSHPNHR